MGGKFLRGAFGLKSNAAISVGEFTGLERKCWLTKPFDAEVHSFVV